MQLIIKKFLLIITFVVSLFISNNSYSSQNNIDDYGIITIMYHRFEENKYPSTNIKIKDFKEHIKIIRNSGFIFLNPNEFIENLKLKKKQKKLMLTVDDAYLSFYQNAWPILKSERIPVLLFVSTREVGKFNYMNWEQIKEIAKEDFVHIGNHSHSHDYLSDFSSLEIREDIETSIKIFKNKLGYNSKFFSYPFGEYSLELKSIIKEFGFTYAFGQHSGVADDTKDLLELPRFPINEKYGSLKRFKTVLNTLPFKYKRIIPEEKYINSKSNPPKVYIEFHEENYDLKNMNCYSNEENIWKKSKINFIEKNKIEIYLIGKFTTERGRINCSLQERDGLWRWLGMQFVVSEN